MKIFFDTEFTGLHKATTLISIGLVTQERQMFYAELTDYDVEQVDQWLKTHVISKLYLEKNTISDLPVMSESPSLWTIKGTKQQVVVYLTRWLQNFPQVEMWSDCLSYDWVLFCDLFGHAFKIPSNIYYIPFDISTLFKMYGFDPDISREEFSGIMDKTRKHNALADAEVIKACFDRLMAHIK